MEGKPAQLLVNIEGRGEVEQFVTIRVVDSTGAGVPAVVRIMAKEGAKDVPTDKSGALLIKARVTEEKTLLNIIVIGTSLDERVPLYNYKGRYKKSEPLSFDEQIQVVSSSYYGKEVDEIEDEKRKTLKILEAEEEIRTKYKEKGWDHDDIEEMVRAFRQRLFQKGIK
jgi:hypothetical protein